MIYYVSTQRGNDNNNGTSQATPFATIAKAITVVAAGNTVYIGPGTYREKPVLATAGTNGNPISWIPDPQCKQLTDDKPGIIRITGCGLDELPTSGIVWNFNAKDYNTLGSADANIYVDGSSDNYSVYANTGTERKCINIIAHGFGGFYYGTNINCQAVCGLWGFYYGTNTSCIAMGGAYGFNYGTNINCQAIGSSYGFYYGTNINCQAVCGLDGFYGSSVGLICNHCRAIACAYGFYGIDPNNKLDTSTASAVWCQTNQRGAGTYETVVVALAKAVIYNPVELIRAFLPLLQFNFDDGDNAVSVGDYDIMGHVRRLCANLIDIGPYEHSKVSTDFTTYKTIAPGVRIERKGMQKFVFWAKGGSQFTCKIWTKWSNVNVAKKPSVVVTGKHVTRTEVAATGTGVDWEQITVSATPAADGEVEFYLYARDEASDALVYFSDFELT